MMDVTRDFLMHHGIKGQEWGIRNGPPYPLKGHKVTKRDYKLSKKGEKHYVIKKGDKIQTLSYDKDRTKNTDMYFASLSNKDKAFYKAFFNKKVPNDQHDENGKRIGPSFYLKYNIKNEAKKDVKMANEREGAESFMKLMENSRDFSNFVLDKNRMTNLMDERRQKFPGYAEAIKTIDAINKGKELTSEDAAKIYRVYNYTIPAEGPNSARQRARFFRQLKKDGYGAVLDINDAIYGKFKMESPAIIFDTDSFDYLDSDRVSMGDKLISSLKSCVTPRY